MLSIQSPCTPDFDQYEENIGASGSRVFVDYGKYVQAITKFIAMRDTAEYECTQLIKLISLNRYTAINRDSLIGCLVDFCGLDQKDFRKKTMDGYVMSIDQAKVLGPLHERLESAAANAHEGYEMALRLLDSYLNYTEYKTLVNNSSAKLKIFKDAEQPGWFGPLKYVNFCYERKRTGRYYTNSDNIQNWNLNMVTSLTCPKGYVLFWCDFDQIDFRVAYNTMLREPGSKYDEVYNADAEDKYRAMFRIMNMAEQQEADLELFKSYRKGYKKAILSAIYNAALNSLAADIHNRELATQLKHYIDTNPGYAEFRRVLNRVINFGIEVPVRDYFGVSRTIPIPSNTNHYELNTAVSQCCNTPIQSTSNSIMMLWLEAVLSRYQSLGYERGVDIQSYLIRHDECVFMLSTKLIQNHFWVMEDYMTIGIDDWGTLSLSPSAGLYYDVEQEEFMELYRRQVEEHKQELTPRTVFSPRKDTYRPVSDVIDVFTYTMHTPVEYAGICGAPEGSIQTDADALAYIKQVAQGGQSNTLPAKQYLEYNDKWILYSSKLDKYCCVPDLSSAVSLCRQIGSTFMNIQNVTKFGQLLYEDIYIKIECADAGNVLRILGSMQQLGYPTEFVSI